MAINLEKPVLPTPHTGITHCVSPEYRYNKHVQRVATGRSSIAISGLTPAQLKVIQAALANVLVSQDGELGNGAGGG